MEISHAHPHAILWPESGQSPTTMNSNSLYYGDNLDILRRHLAAGLTTQAARWLWDIFLAVLSSGWATLAAWWNAL